MKSPEEQASLDTMWDERHKLNESLISLLWMIIEKPEPDPTMGVQTEQDRVNYIRATMKTHRNKLNKLFTAHERRFP